MSTFFQQHLFNNFTLNIKIKQILFYINLWHDDNNVIFVKNVRFIAPKSHPYRKVFASWLREGDYLSPKSLSGRALIYTYKAREHWFYSRSPHIRVYVYIVYLGLYNYACLLDSATQQCTECTNLFFTTLSVFTLVHKCIHGTNKYISYIFPSTEFLSYYGLSNAQTLFVHFGVLDLDLSVKFEAVLIIIIWVAIHNVLILWFNKSWITDFILDLWVVEYIHEIYIKTYIKNL